MSDKNPKILVFMSCFNHEKYVAESIETILNQTYKNIELMIVNDGSKDQSAQVISQYLDDSRVHFVDLKENTSAVGAFEIINQYIFDTPADYIAGASSDDKWELDKLEKQVAFLEKNPEYKACFTWDQILCEENMEKWTLGKDYAKQKNMDRYAWFRRFLYGGNCLNAVSVMMKHEVYKELGGYNWTFRQLQDFAMWMMLVQKYPFYIIQEPLTYYRRHNSNLSAQSLEGNIRLINESTALFRKILCEMDDSFFKKSFYLDFCYSNASSHTQLLAEKISMLIKQDRDLLNQVGFDLYMDHSLNKELIHLLEDQYNLSPAMFHKLTGKNGLVLNLVRDNPDFPKTADYSINQINLLIQNLDQKNMTVEMLQQFCYKSLVDLYKVSASVAGGLKDFEFIKNIVWQIQEVKLQTKKKKEICILVSDESYISKETVQEMKDIGQEDTVYFCMVPKKETIFCQSKNHISMDQAIGCYEVKTIFEKEAHRVCYLWEKNLSPDIIYLKVDAYDLYEFEPILRGALLDTVLMYSISENSMCKGIQSSELYDLFRKNQ